MMPPSATGAEPAPEHAERNLLSRHSILVLYIATVHYESPRWIEIQASYLREHMSLPYRTWASLEGIDSSYAVHFDRVVGQLGPHAGKLNHLAMEISNEASEDDLLMFLDGDAFPIADPMPLITDALSKAPLVAVRRAENLGEPQPHPCFCVTTVGLWRSLPGDWSVGPTWAGPNGRPRTDVGANLLRALQLGPTPWVEVLRSNRRDEDPVYFGVYGDVIYHHGAGFRGGTPSGVHRADAPAGLRAPRVEPLGALIRAVNRRRYRAWERTTQARRLEQSRTVYEKIRAGGSDWVRDFI
jgi:hypothetical protein